MSTYQQQLTNPLHKSLPLLIDTFSLPLKDKRDIIVRVYRDKYGINPNDIYTPLIRTYPTLLQGSVSTKLTYSVTGLSKEDIKTVNSLNAYDIQGRLKLIEDLGGKIEYKCVKNQILSHNIDKIDSWMDKILSYTLIYLYKDNISLTSDLVNCFNQSNPFNYGGQKTYTVRFRKLLAGVLCGLGNGQRVSGFYSIPYGYRIHYLNGDEFSFHVPDRNTFKEILLENTIFNKPDPVKCDYGYIYTDCKDNLIDLGVEISFINWR